VVQGNSSPTISNNTIRNNYYHGIIVVSNGTGNPIITGNAVESNGIVNGNKIYNGINFYYSAGKVVENTVRYNNFGVYCDSYSSPSSSHGGQGRNLITANRFGILVHYNSNPTFGVFNSSTNQYVGACNKILANDVVNAKAQYSSTLWAQGTWWGADPPDASQIVAVENSLIEYSYWRPFDDNDCISGPQPKIVGTTASPPEDFPTLLRTALLARLRGDYAAAGAAYRAVLSGSAKIEERRRALVGLFELFRDSKDHSLVNIIAQYRNTTGELGLVASELSAASLMAMGDYNPAKQILASLRSRYPKTEVEQRALVLLASLNGYTLAEQSSANSALLELLEKFEAAIDRGLLVALGGVVLQEGSNRLAAHESSPASLAVVNYPNPFNPSTVIQFTLPDAGHVSLKVFDLLGREVATLLDEHRTAGTHQVHFDARALPSGLYFYRLDAAGTLAIQKMLLAR
jgi:parallel beta-helix repeat protein